MLPKSDPCRQTKWRDLRVDSLTPLAFALYFMLLYVYHTEVFATYINTRICLPSYSTMLDWFRPPPFCSRKRKLLGTQTKTGGEALERGYNHAIDNPDGKCFNQAFTEVSNPSPLPWIKHLFLQWTTIFAELLRYLY